MSEFTENYKSRVEKLTNYTLGLIEGKKGSELLENYKILETTFLPRDIFYLFDNIFEKVNNIEKIKTASNKLFNILYKNLSEYKKYNYPKNSILTILTENNKGVIKLLADTRQFIKKVNANQNKNIINKLKQKFSELEKFTVHYTVKENILFPGIEKHIENYQCLKLMWSFHDDIRKNIKRTLEILTAQQFDLKLFNKISSKLYFNINTIIFREEYVLFPVTAEIIEDNILRKMLLQLSEFDLPYATISDIQIGNENKTYNTDNKNIIKFKTGELTLEQAELIFNHLPVDISFVDENNIVKFYSSPKHRIFPRTSGVIGRTVQNCHPHESVEIVNKIVASFKSGEKDIASFWIHMGLKFVLIQYFAVRDENNYFKGILEVSQEISEIQKIEGERRLLDW